MFDAAGGSPTGWLSTAELAAFVARLPGLGTDVDDGERLDRVRLLEELKSATAAAQARTTTAFVGSQRERQRAAGVPAARVGQGIAGQVGLARRESPARAARYGGWTKILVEELPATFGALARGQTTEWRAMLVARETIWLSRADRATVDTALAGRLGALGDPSRARHRDRRAGAPAGIRPGPGRDRPCDIARGTEGTAGWLRRLYTKPDTGQLAAIDARRRRFDGVTRFAIIVRDQICRTPWCGAPIRHGDHALAVAAGGETSLDTGQGLCEACNYAKQAPGWSVTPGPGGTGTSVHITTPTGHTYTSRPPDLPGQHHGPAPPTAHHHAA